MAVIVEEQGTPFGELFAGEIMGLELESRGKMGWWGRAVRRRRGVVKKVVAAGGGGGVGGGGIAGAGGRG